MFVDIRTKCGSTPLHLAVKNGHLDLVTSLVQTYGADIEAIDLDGFSPLHSAAKYGRGEICSFLLRQGANAAILNSKKRSPVHLATEGDHPDIVKLFLNTHDDSEILIDRDDSGYTCAHIAATKGSAAVLKELITINKDAVLRAKDGKKRTTLHLASANGHKNVVSLLLSAGASSSEEDENGMTPLMLAIEHGQISTISAFDRETWNKPSKINGFYPLHVAAYFGQLQFIKVLLATTPASVVTLRPEGSNYFDVQYQFSLTPLHIASLVGHEHVVRFLLNVSSVIVDDTTKPDDFTALHLAAISGDVKILGLLVNRSRSLINRKDVRGRTALHHAARKGKTRIVDLLISQGSNINEQDFQEWTPLHHACWAGELEIVDVLIKNRCDLRVENCEGKLALCLAAANGHRDVVTRIVEVDGIGEKFLRDKEFLIDVMLCCDGHDFDVVEKLIMATEDNPLRSAVILSRTYKLLTDVKKCSSRDLYACSDFCQSVTCKLVNILIEHTEPMESDCHVMDYYFDSKNKRLIDYLIENEQKLVVSQNSVQKYVDKLWFFGFKINAILAIFLFFSLLIFPPFWLFLCLPFQTRWHEAPLIKLLCRLVSHIYFCILIMSVTLRWLKNASDIELTWSSINEILLALWIVGLLVAEFHIAQKQPTLLDYLRMIQIFLGISALLLHFVAFTMFEFENLLLSLYVRNQLLSCTLLLAFVRFLEFLSSHHLFGPWAVTIRHLLHDLAKFWAILLLFFLAFLFTITSLYQPVFLSENHNVTSTNSASLIKTMEILYFAMFGMLDPEAAISSDVQVPTFVKIVVKAFVGLYLMVIIVVLINLLIAMMSDTYRKIENRSDVEWKFGRAKLIREMVKSHYPPVPINLLFYLIRFGINILQLRSKNGYDLINMSTNKRKERENGNSSSNMFYLKTAMKWKCVVHEYYNQK